MTSVVIVALWSGAWTLGSRLGPMLLLLLRPQSILSKCVGSCGISNEIHTSLISIEAADTVEFDVARALAHLLAMLSSVNKA